jgi:ribosomal protein S18 acetylase RimI-like enzyme
LQAFYDDSYNLQKFIDEFSEQGAQLYLALDDLKIIGFLRLRVNSEADHDLGKNHIELHRLYIHRDYQGGNISRLLMDQALNYAAEKKFEWIWLGVWEKNFRAQKFYTRWGFERFGEHVFSVGDDPQIDWLMKKKL